MVALANEHHFSCVPKEKLLAELGHALAKRMIKRRGDQVYQMLAFSLPYFPRELLKEIFPKESLTEESPKKVTWELTSVSEIASAIAPLLQKSSYPCAGSTKAFRTKSERVVRVVAKMMPPMEVAHEVSSSGMERLYLNGMYVLATENGELHFPKDNQRRELLIETKLEQALREETLRDVKELGSGGLLLSPSWWRQLGNEEKATEMEKSMAAQNEKLLQRMKNKDPGARAVKRKPQTSNSTFEIDRITGEKNVSGKAKKLYLVRWAGYNASWEPWRISGLPGETIETWEPARLLKNTVALKEWKERHRSSSPNVDH